jgi:Asp-tRNA(Asn)/Glu-tRNA(Gln) amidotransferase A subunit family amidase
MGPLARRVETCKRVVRALAPSLRVREENVSIDPSRVLLYTPDDAHRGKWPTFERDAEAHLAAAGLRVDRDHGLPSPSEVNELFGAYLSSHFFDFIGAEELPFKEGLAATALGVLTDGRLDKRLHPVSASLFALVGIGRLVRYRDAAREEGRLETLRAAAKRAWDTGRLIVTPTTTALPPKHRRAVLALRAPSFVMLGNMTDATGIAVPFGRFEATSLPRSLQILGPPGSEDAVLEMASRLEK